jgi:hypothetical protein
MVTVVHTVHRMVPKLVERARETALLDPRRLARNASARYRAKYSREERRARYAVVVAMNRREGIDPRAAQAKRKSLPKVLRIGQHKRYRNARGRMSVTVAKTSV